MSTNDLFFSCCNAVLLLVYNAVVEPAVGLLYICLNMEITLLSLHTASISRAMLPANPKIPFWSGEVIRVRSLVCWSTLCLFWTILQPMLLTLKICQKQHPCRIQNRVPLHPYWPVSRDWFHFYCQSCQCVLAIARPMLSPYPRTSMFSNYTALAFLSCTL